MPTWERLSALDASFLGLEDGRTHMHVGATMIFEPGDLVGPHGELDIAALRKSWEAKLHLVPRYRQKVAWVPYEKHPVWVDDDRFNIEYHIRLAALPRPGGEAELKRLSARIMSQQLDRGKPLWEAWYVEGLKGGRFALISKTHHCMIDGIAGTDLMQVLLDIDPKARAGRPHTWKPRRSPHAVSLAVGAVRHRLEMPAEIFKATRRAIRRPAALVKDAEEYLGSIAEALKPGLRGGSQTPINAPVGPHRRFEWLDLPLADVKAVKNALGGTVNDVVLATVAGMLRRFLRHRGIATDGLDLKALVPVSVRPEEARGQTGNQIAMMIAPLPVKLRDPEARLAAVRKTMQGLKESKMAIGAERLSAVADWTVPNIIVQAVRIQTRARAYNLVVTNVPGPQIPLYMEGAEMTAAYPVVPLMGANQALGIALLSYNGKLCWGLHGDWEALADLDRVAHYLREAFEELQELAGTRPARRKKPTATTRPQTRTTGAKTKRPAAASAKSAIEKKTSARRKKPSAGAATG